MIATPIKEGKGKGGTAMDGGWRPQLRGGSAGGGKDHEDEEILLADRRSSESVRSGKSDLGEDGIEKEREDGDRGDGDEYEHEDESEIGEGQPQRGLSRSTKGTIWVVLMTLSTLIGRRLLRGGFREFFLLFWCFRRVREGLDMRWIVML